MFLSQIEKRLAAAKAVQHKLDDAKAVAREKRAKFKKPKKPVPELVVVPAEAPASEPPPDPPKARMTGVRIPDDVRAKIEIIQEAEGLKSVKEAVYFCVLVGVAVCEETE